MNIIYWIIAIGLFCLMFHPAMFERGWDQAKYIISIAVIALLWPIVLLIIIGVTIYLKIKVKNDDGQ